MRLPPNAGDLASLTSELKNLILCLGKVLHVLVIQRQKNCIVFFLLSNSATKMHLYGKIFPCLTKTSCSWRCGEISTLKFRIMMKTITMILQVHTDVLSFSLALFQNELKNYSEGEWLNQRNLMKLLQLIPQITIQTSYPSFQP